jgi:hypothetical protein
MAVSQCARFTHNPKRSHELALEQIGQYLKGTKDPGLILQPADAKEIKINCYVDANFAGLWGYEHDQDPTSVKRRTGYAIFIQWCPIVWKSKIQGGIATSTMESEYKALSIWMRDVLPLLLLTKIIANALGVTKIAVAEFQAPKHKPEKPVRFETDIQFETAMFKTTLHEDNTGARILAKMEIGRMTLRSKHY